VSSATAMAMTVGARMDVPRAAGDHLAITIGALTPKLAWYMSRASGIVAWLLLVTSILWGLVLSARVLNKATAPGWLLDLHRFLGAACLILTGVHLLSLVADNWVYFGWRELFIPSASKWRTGAVNWGIGSFYLLVLIEVTSLLRKWIGRRVWRLTHYLSFPLFVASTVHGLQAGHDRGARFYGWMTAAGVSVFVTLGLIRVVAMRNKRTSPARPAAGSAGQSPA
jgi:predicted ferric reductase